MPIPRPPLTGRAPRAGALVAVLLTACGSSGGGGGKAALGAPCSGDGGCQSPYVCSAGTCQAAAEGEACPNGNECASPLVCQAGTCTANVGASCTGQSGCAASLVCHLGTCVASEPAAASCATPGASPPIVNGGRVEVADPGAGACVLPVRAPAAVPGAVRAYGAQQVGSDLSFEVPAGTTGISIVSQEVAQAGTTGTAVESVQITAGGQSVTVPNSVVPTALTDPAGTTLWDDFVFPSDPERVLAYYGGVTPSSGTFTLPDTPPLLDRLYTQGALPAGTWRFRVNDWAYECTAPRLATTCGGSGSASGVYDVTVLTRDAPLASTGALDLAMYLVTNRDTPGQLDAASAAGDAGFRRYVDSVATVLGRAGLCVGKVTVYDLPDWARDRYHALVVDDDPTTGDVDEGSVCGPLSQLFTLSAAGGDAVQLFLVDELRSSSDTGDIGIAGIDGSIPGPSGVPGTVNSGAAVGLGSNLSAGQCGGELSLERCGPDLLAYVTAHEIGHWLGLYHVTDQSGEVFDPLTDTPTCSCSACAKTPSEVASCPGGGATMYASYCDGAGDAASCGGGDNLMFWLADQSVSVGRLSRQQGQVMRLNPAVR